MRRTPEGRNRYMHDRDNRSQLTKIPFAVLEFLHADRRKQILLRMSQSGGIQREDVDILLYITTLI
jgi:hypothetical protein